MAKEKAGKEPEVKTQFTVWMTAYFELITCRNERGMIPWDSISKYAEVYNLPLEILRRIIRRVDAAVIEAQTKNKKRH